MHAYRVMFQSLCHCLSGSAEDGKMFCSYCKEFDKTSRNKFISGCESMRIENVRSHEASNTHETSHSAFLNSKKRPTEQLIVKALITMEKHNIDLMKKKKKTVYNCVFFCPKAKSRVQILPS